uniref:Dynein light chain n=1 Tax=Bicosoecida sp. CB-2014 TaxID=1486930 RepID=A0A7S1G226_9STRA|mmetsp:Transcript_10873/g.37888  ORF Transcript_10873/g.37888 Transcript_10873/m.37888 type:complete len:133 (+) Transcript_10873:200-598(+)
MAYEDDGPTVIKHYEPTYLMKPKSEELKFRPSQVRKITTEVVHSTLDGKTWNGEEEAMWTVQIAEEIKRRVKELNVPRYKIIVQVTLGEVKSQGVRVASRCLWDTDTDNYCSYSHKSETMWCVVMVFGTYTE